MTALPPSLFPDLSWFVRFAGTEKVRLTATEGTFSNKLHLRGPNGLLAFTIPISKHSNKNRPIIADTEKWRRACWHSLQTAYGTAPFFDYYEYLVSPLILSSETDYYNLCFKSVSLVCEFLNWSEPEWELEELAAEPIFNLIALSDYGQRFTERYPFSMQVSILDLIFQCGPLSRDVLAGKPL